MGKTTCLLIDDDIDDQEIFIYALKGMEKSVTIVTAGDGMEALEILDADKTFIPDYIFLDLNMPRMNGKECLQELRKLPRLNRIPIIIYTTSSDEKDFKDTQQLGATGFLSKPPSTEHLKILLINLFRRHNI